MFTLPCKSSHTCNSQLLTYTSRVARHQPEQVHGHLWLHRFQKSTTNIFFHCNNWVILKQIIATFLRASTKLQLNDIKMNKKKTILEINKLEISYRPNWNTTIDVRGPVQWIKNNTIPTTKRTRWWKHFEIAFWMHTKCLAKMYKSTLQKPLWYTIILRS